MRRFWVSILWLMPSISFRSSLKRRVPSLGVNPAPPTTLTGVAALAVPDLLVEIEATALLD